MDRTPPGSNRRWLVARRLEGNPEDSLGPSLFSWKESPIPTPADGQALVRNLWLSFDPTQIFMLSSAPESGGLTVGAPMWGLTASQVVESRHPGLRRGDLVHGYSGWEDYSLIDGHGYFETTKIPSGVTPNLALGTLGVTGMVAYFGVVEIGKPQRGETFVVSSAAGGVGSIAGQIAKIRGARVVGIAGGKEKCERVLRELRFDAVIDYRVGDVGTQLASECPDGIDVYFDNAGGPILDAALERLRSHGRVVLCGGTSQYGRGAGTAGPSNYLQLVMINGRMEGLLGKDYAPRFPEATPVMLEWLRTGQLRSIEDVETGLEHAPEGLARLYHRANFGKQLLKIADPSDLGVPPT